MKQPQSCHHTTTGDNLMNLIVNPKLERVTLGAGAVITGVALQAMSDDADAGRLPLDSDRAFYFAEVHACDNMVLTETTQSF